MSLTKLAAVNIMLSMAGLPRTSSLSTDSEVVNCQDVLDEVSTQVQNKGWHWNTSIVTLTPDTSGHINLPPNTLKADPLEVNNNHIVKKGSLLYNTRDMSPFFTEGVNTELILKWDFEEIPQAVQYFITVSAGRLFQQRYVGSQALDAANKDTADNAWLEVSNEEADIGDYNFLQEPMTNLRADRSIREGVTWV